MENSRVVNLRIHPVKKTLLWTGGIIALLLIAYNVWAYAGRAKEKKTGWVDLPPAGRTRFREFDIGRDRGKGNILVVQPYLTPQNYSTAFNFFVSLKMYLRQAKRDSLIKANTIVAFPEHIGTWLFASNEKESVYNKSTTGAAARMIFFSNFFSLVRPYFSLPSGDHDLSRAVLQHKSESMAEVYDSTFSSLAKEYGVTILAGSIILPDPFIDEDGNLKSKQGQLFNTYAIYSSSGKIIGPLLRSEISHGAFVSYDSSRSAKFNRISGVLPQLNLCICENRDREYPLTASELSSDVLLSFQPYSSGAFNDVSKMPTQQPPGITSSKKDSLKAAPGQSVNNASLDSLPHGGLAFRFSGDLWDQFSDGNLRAKVRIAGKDSVIDLGSAERRGRIVNYWLY